MQLTKFSHACVRITDGEDRRLVVDPGSFSEVEEALDGVESVLITHQHADHVDVDRLAAAASANPGLRVWAPKDAADQLADVASLQGRVTVVGSGESFVAGGLPVRTFGGQHALIHSSVPVVQNVGYLIGEAIYHPGDSYVVPTAGVELLLAPLTAPWAKLSETLDFIIAVRAARCVQIHDAVVSDVGRTVYAGHAGRVGAQYGTDFELLGVRQTVDV